MPTNPLHLLALLVPLLLWLGGRSMAKKHRFTIMHTASFGVSYWEELLFRAAIWGIIEWMTGSVWIALILSSVLFGLFHMRNSWWASKERLLSTCLYTGLVVGPILGLVRIWSGDIYIGVALHAIHNFIVMYYTGTKSQPKDDYLRSRHGRRNWFARLFSRF